MCERCAERAFFRAFDGFYTGHSGIEVEWVEESNQDVKEKIASMQAEVGIVVGHTRLPEVQEMKLASRAIRLIVYRGHPLYERSEIGIDELRGERIIILNEQFEIYHTFAGGLQGRKGSNRILQQRRWTAAFVSALQGRCRHRRGDRFFHGTFSDGRSAGHTASGTDHVGYLSDLE